LHILVTAGPTREYLDPVRYISNASSGKMGFAVARAAMARGHQVTLVTGPVAMRDVKAAKMIYVETTAQMARACLEVFKKVDAVIMTAAVCDYKPASKSDHKLKKLKNGKQRVTIEMSPSTDILTSLSQRKRKRQVVVGFALEDRAGKANATQKLQDKKLDAIVLNGPASIAADASDFMIISADGTCQHLPGCSKRRLAGRLIRLVEQTHRNR